MTSHELARMLLEKPDLPVVLKVYCSCAEVSGIRDFSVGAAKVTPDRVAFNDENGLPLTDPTAVFVEGWSDEQFDTYDDEDDEE